MKFIKKNVIFVGGIHGVGKTYFCSNLSQNINRQHFSCSELISKFKDINPQNKLTKDIDENQTILKLALDTYLLPTNDYILDGHFCLINEQGDISRIPESTFINLNISNILVLENDCNIIIDNLKKRDNKIYKESLIQKFQQEEILYAKYIANLLDINIEIIKLNNMK